MATGHDDRFSMEKLDGNNYPTWKIQMCCMLLARDLWGHVDETEKVPKEEEGKRAFGKAKLKAFVLIMMEIPASLIYLIQDLDSPVDAWKALGAHFERGTISVKLHLRKKYWRMEMSEGASMEKHLRDMRDMMSRLAIIGSAVL